MTLIFVQEAEPASPSASKMHVYLGTDKKLRIKNEDGSLTRLGNDHPPRNLLINGGFRFFQRQTPGTLTTYSNTSGRTYGPDRWGITNENASAQVRRVDSLGAFESGLSTRYYCEAKKITSAGKLVLSQALESDAIAHLRGRSVRVQFKAKNSVGSHTLRCALLSLASPGTSDTIPATFVSAFGANGTDPTWGSNLAAVAPSKAGTNSSVAGNGISSVLNSSWRTYGGVFSVPTTALNLVVVIFSNSQMAADDIVHLSEVGMYDGEDEREFTFDPQEDLARCLRYYHKSFDIDVAPVQNIGAITGAIRITAQGGSSTTSRSPHFPHPVRMRTAPTGTTYNPLAANAQARDSTASVDCSSTTIQSATQHGYAYVTTGNASTTAGNQLSVHVSFDAEL